MCAIAGFVDLRAEPSVLGKLLGTMAHRGPDEQGSFVTDRATLLHTRLTIIDPLGGSQPMTLDWGEERYRIVYNGELYNTAEVRYLLQKEGHVFQGHSDTEVVLHAYARWGEDCVGKFNGIFAIGVWEEKAKRLFLARDRIGVKPLFYTRYRDGLIFASEMKTLLAFPGIKAELDEEGAAELLLLGPGRTPGCGIFHGIREIEPGCCAYFRDGELKIRRYWKLTDREHRENFGETAECVRYLVTDAIKRQMVSDFPVGTFLSGGLDSSLITAVCAGEMEGRGELLQTFSLDYEGNDRNFVPGKFQPDSDSGYIRLLQEQLNTDHHWTVLTSDELLETLADAVIARDLPGMADVDASLLAFCRRIRKNVKVALSGECADEIFGGYPWYRDPEIRAAEGFPWAQNSAQRLSLLGAAVKIDGESYIQDRYAHTCRESDILPGNAPQEIRMKEMMNLNFRWFMQTLLDRKDRMSMATGLEVRVPFCDYRIAEYLYAVPWEFKDHKGKEKGLLRTAMEGVLPREVLWRKKSPYPKTFDPGYGEAVLARLERVLAQEDSPLFHLVDRSALSRLLTSEHPWPWYGQLMRGPQTAAYFLQLEFWLRHYEVSFLF